jgi:uracil-DNA glycosylase family 4
MFIGEAPGRLGAALTGVPFTSDQSGLRFERLLEAAGLRRDEVFVTNALLCNPLRDGKNRSPRRSEIANCTCWLKAQLDIVTPRLVVTLGAVALEAVRLSWPHTYELRRDVGCPLPWYGRTLVPLYHPSPRTAARRSFAQQIEDFRGLAGLIADC